MNVESMQMRIDRFRENFDLLEDWPDQCAYLMAIGRMHPLEPFERSEINRISGCQSNAWMNIRLDDQGFVWISIDSDALIIKGILGMVAEALSGETAESVCHANLRFLEEIGLFQKVTSSRATGIRSAIRQIMAFCQKAGSLASKGE